MINANKTIGLVSKCCKCRFKKSDLMTELVHSHFSLRYAFYAAIQQLLSVCRVPFEYMESSCQTKQFNVQQWLNALSVCCPLRKTFSEEKYQILNNDCRRHHRGVEGQEGKRMCCWTAGSVHYSSTKRAFCRLICNFAYRSKKRTSLVIKPIIVV